MNLPPEILRAIKRKGYRLPTPIQRRALPPALAGHDVVAMARTGSGKTAAFAIPVVAALRRHTRAAPPFGGSRRTFPGGQPLPLERLLELPCDVFIPAAVPSVVNARTAKTLGCKFLVEAANASTTPEGDRILRERGIVALPDIVSVFYMFFCSLYSLFFKK